MYKGYILKHNFPTLGLVSAFVDNVQQLLFAVVDTENDVAANEQQLLPLITSQLQQLLISSRVHAEQVPGLVHIFNRQINTVRQQLLQDAEFIFRYDPAADCLEEVILTYPGFYAIAVYRVANILYKQQVAILPRMMSEIAHSKTGIDINAGANIGCPFFIDHGTGIVIGETTEIGNNVKIYQGVTLGAIMVHKEDAAKKRHPTILNDVVIYSGSTILGGNTVIGSHSIIGGNTWLTSSVPSNSIVYHTAQTVVKDRNSINEPINFII